MSRPRQLIQGGGITTSGSNVAQPKTSESIAQSAQTSAGNANTAAQTSSTTGSTSNSNAVSPSKTTTSEKNTAAKSQTSSTEKPAQSSGTTSQDYNTKQSTYNTAKQNYETAKRNTQKAADAKEAAAKQKETANQKLADAKKDVSDKTSAVKTAEGDVTKANDALSQAKKDVDSTKADVAEKEAAFEKAKAAYDQAKADADKKDNAFSDAQNKLDAMQKGSLLEKAQKELTDAQNAEEKAQDAYDSAKAKADNAKNTLDSAKTAKESAASQVTDAQKATDDANTKVEAAQKALDEAQKNWDEAGRKFIESHLDADQTYDAYIKGTIAALAVDNNETLKYMTDPHFTTALNRTLSVENLEKDADFIEECNELRAKNGLNPLLISYSGMQEATISAANTSVATNVYGVIGHVGHVGISEVNAEMNKTYPQLENAAWAYDDPYDGWYYGEQQTVNFIHAMMGQDPNPKRPTEKHWSEAECCSFLKKTMGWSDAQINDYFKEVPYGKMTYKQMCDFMNNNQLSAGHYNAVLSDEVLRTGIAFVDDEADIYGQSMYGITTIQEFYGTEYDYIWVSSKDAEGNQINTPKTVPHVQTDTPAAFKQKLQDFTKDLKDKLAKAKQALADAQTAQTKANEKLAAAQTALTEADASYADAQAKVKAADQAFTDAQNALNAAKANTADKQQVYNDALNAEKDRAEAIKAQQKAVEAARQDKAAAHQALADAENAKNTANQNLTAAKQAQAKADKAYQDANTKVNDTTNALNTAKGALKISQDHQSTAQVEAETALANETAKIEAFKNAQGLEKEAYNAYKKSGDDLVSFVDSHINALPDTDSLTLNDKDDVDTMSKIADAVPSELKSELKQNNLKKLNASKQKMADLVLIQKDKDAAKAVADKVKTLPEEITADNASSVYDVQKAYNNLSDRQKDYVGEAAQNKIAAAVKAADKATADAVNDAIAALPDQIALKDKAAVKDARAAYDALTDGAKSQVDPARLTAAEKAIQSLEKQKADNDAAKKVDTLINSLPKNPSAKDRDGIMNVYRRYQALSASAKAMLPEGDLAKLLAAMKAANAANPAGTNGNTVAVTAKTANGTASASPKTGDSTAAGAEAAAILAAIAGLGFARRRRRESEEDA